MEKCQILKNYINGTMELKSVLREQWQDDLNSAMSSEKFNDLWDKAKKLESLETGTYQQSRYPVCSITRSLCQEHCDACWPVKNTREERLRYRLQQYVAASWNLTYVRDIFQCQLGHCKDDSDHVVDGLKDVNAYRSMTIEHLLPVRPPRKPLEWRWDDKENWCLDVLIQNSPENLVCACRHCNAVKGNRLFYPEKSREEYLALSRKERLKSARGLMKNDEDSSELDSVRKILNYGMEAL